MDKMTVLLILLIGLGTIGFFMLFLGSIYFLSLKVSDYKVKAWIDRLFNILTFIPESIRKGPEYGIRKTMHCIRWTNESFGVHGEDGGQRITGSFIYFSITLLSIFASLLILIVTFDAIFGNGNSKILEYLPEYLNIEVIMAAELIFASILFGLVLFDIIGVTDLSKFFSPQKLSKNVRFVIGIITALCIFVSIYLFASAGNFRFHGAEIEINKQLNPETSTSAYAGNPDKNMESSVDNNHVSPSYLRSVKALTVLTPVIAFLATGFGSAGSLPLVNFVFIGIVFVLSMLLFGPIWVTGFIIEGIVVRISDFFRGFLYLIIDIASSQKKKETKDDIVSFVPAIPLDGDGKIKKEHNISTSL